MADKVIRGSKDAKQYVVLQGARDRRQLRCKHCTGLAIQVPDGKGGSIYECLGCHRRYQFTAL